MELSAIWKLTKIKFNKSAMTRRSIFITPIFLTLPSIVKSKKWCYFSPYKFRLLNILNVFFSKLPVQFLLIFQNHYHLTWQNLAT